jgi:hypothetical protein
MPKVDDDIRLAAAKAVREISERSAVILGELDRVCESEGFRKSRRCREFLRYVIEKALEGSFDELKERVIGSALFQRPLDYDTSSDAIVRVVASETRKRLHQYYAGEGRDVSIRFELPSGHYIPTVRIARNEPAQVEAVDQTTATTHRDFVSCPRRLVVRLARHTRRHAVLLGVSIAALVLLFQNLEFRRINQAASVSPSPVLPWKALFAGDHHVQIVLGDTSVGGVHLLMQRPPSLADYLKGQVVPNRAELDGRIAPCADFLLANQFTSLSYATIGARIAQIYSSPASISYARTMSLRTFRGGDHMVVIGSALAIPWVRLLEERLNFVTEFDATAKPFLRNRAPVSGEPALYMPHSRKEDGLQEYYGHLAFLPFAHQKAHAVLVSGLTSGGVEGAGELLTDERRLSAAMKGMGLDPGGAPRGFEILLKVTTTSHAPLRSEIIAWRVFPDAGTGR